MAVPDNETDATFIIYTGSFSFNDIERLKNIAMKKIHSIILFAFSAFMMLSCESKIEEPARDVLSEVHKELQAGNYNVAKMLIDSIKAAHPKAYKTLREAEALRREVLVKEKERDIAFFDNELQRLTEMRDTMLKEFDYSKNAKYQDVGVYSVPSQAISKNAFNSYLRATVKEDGDAVLTSYYRGSRIGYKAVKVMCGEVYVSADECIYSWTGKEHGVYVERRDFKRGEDGGMMDFIATANGKVVVELSGTRTHEYELRQEDIKAITMVKELSDVLLAIRECREMRDAAQYSLDFLMKGSERLRKDSVAVEG